MKPATMKRLLVALGAILVIFSACATPTAPSAPGKPAATAAPAATKAPAATTAPAAQKEVPQAVPTLVLPPELQNGKVFPPPEDDGKSSAQAALRVAMEKAGISVEQYSTEKVVVYPSPEEKPQQVQFYAAPAKGGSNAFPPNTYLGVFWDAGNECGNGSSAVYQVKFSPDFKTAIMEGKDAGRNPVTCERQAAFASQPTPLPEHTTVALFGQINPCFLCLCCDSGCGCLICVK